jgi:CBS domain containing-hemolysin-like protein
LEIINLLLIVVLIALTAFFVASEFAVIKVRSTRIDQLVLEGNKNAIAAKKVIENLDEYLSACQLGITITALGLGWLGEPTIHHLLEPVFIELNMGEATASIVAFIIAFSLITFLHVVVGELAPKTLAIQKAEKVSLMFSRPLIHFYRLMYPFIWALNGSARLITGLFGLKPAGEHEEAHSEEELRMILSDSYESGEINQAEYKYVNNIFQFDDRIAKEIMVPRTSIVSISKDITFDELIEIVTEENYTRYPVEDGSKDRIAGMVNVKELLIARLKCSCDNDIDLNSFIKPVIHVIESIPIHQLLLRMQNDRIHMAILVDEYGGTAGLVTFEDILEEIVGEIRDEFDFDETSEIVKLTDEHYIFDGKVLIEEVNDLLGIELFSEEMDTIGGFILSRKFDVKVGDSITEQGFNFIIIEVDGNQIVSIEVKKATDTE